MFWLTAAAMNSFVIEYLDLYEQPKNKDKKKKQTKKPKPPSSICPHLTHLEALTTHACLEKIQMLTTARSLEVRRHLSICELWMKRVCRAAKVQKTIFYFFIIFCLFFGWLFSPICSVSSRLRSFLRSKQSSATNACRVYRVWSKESRDIFHS